MLILCTKYLDRRLNIFNTAKNSTDNLDNSDVETQFISILQSDDPSLVHVYHIFLKMIEHIPLNAGHENVDTYSQSSN